MKEGSGQLLPLLGQGDSAADPIADSSFGCAGVPRTAALQKTLQTIAYLGHRHHVICTPGHVAEPAHEAFTKYLG